ncbi:MAG TPA: urease accessory UreF family protein [Trebonia sp.]|nr:urease accessory UreF family protein [Trebonia sp.]
MSVSALLLSDSRFPAGGHAHSGGVEPAVTAGTVSDLASLEAFLRGRLRTAGLVAAGLAAAACACAAVRHGAERWDLLDAEADARTPSPAQRAASRRQGRALLRAARVTWPEDFGLAALAVSPAAKWADASGGADVDGSGGRRGGAGGGLGGGSPQYRGGGGAGGGRRGGNPEYRSGAHHAVVLGAAAAAAGCDVGDAARIAAYQSVAGAAGAAVRLLALDPMRAAAVLARLAGDIDRIAERAAAAADGPFDELPCPSAPALDLLAEAHIRAEVRLFES